MASDRNLMMAIGDEIKQSEQDVKQGMTAQNEIMMQNLQVLRDVIIDLSTEFDASYTEIDKLKLSEERTQSMVDEMQKKFDYIRAKMETKLFSDMTTSSPVKQQPISPGAMTATIPAREMLSPKGSQSLISMEQQMELMKRV